MIMKHKKASDQKVDAPYVTLKLSIKKFREKDTHPLRILCLTKSCRIDRDQNQHRWALSLSAGVFNFT